MIYKYIIPIFLSASICQSFCMHFCIGLDEALLLAAKVNNDTVWKDRKTLELVNTLIKLGANVNAQDTNQRTPLILASIQCSSYIVDALIKAGADVNRVDKYGKTALYYAICSRQPMMTNTLLNAKADIPDAYHTQILRFAIDVKKYFVDFTLQVINPKQKPSVRKKIETLLMIRNKKCSYLSKLPKELLKIIITYAHPEYAMDGKLLCCLHPDSLVGTLPLETLAILIKDKKLNEELILAAWHQRIISMTQSLKGLLPYKSIKQFAIDTLKSIHLLLTGKALSSSNIDLIKSTVKFQTEH